MITAEQVTGPIAHHGEGPVWDSRTGMLYWVGMPAGDVLSGNAGSPVTRRHVGQVAAALRPRADGGMVLALEREFALTDAEWTSVQIIGSVSSDPRIRLNEGACDPQGRFYCGTMAYDAAPGAGTLYRLDPARAIQPVLSGVTISNGLVWSPDGCTAYYVDTATSQIDAFDFDGANGRLCDRRVVTRIEPRAGAPDGVTVDSEGGIWVALWDGAAVHRYTPGGVLDAVIDLPTPRVTACTFGGPDLGDLYITTSRHGLDDGAGLAGSLFHARPGISGLPVAEFAG